MSIIHARIFKTFVLLTVIILYSKTGFTETEIINPQDLLKPSICPSYFALDESTRLCAKDDQSIMKLNELQCKGDNLKLDNGTCIAIKDNIQPICKSINSYTARLIGAGTSASCQHERITITTSSQGDYIGDCFIIRTPIDEYPLEIGKHYFVTAQDNQNKENPQLSLIEAGEWEVWDWLMPIQKYTPGFGCRPTEAAKRPVRIQASRLSESGATRRGYAYGVLTMPYKYFPSKKSFSVGLPIGGYIGWRVGQPGAGGTFALAMTLSSVKADIVDPKTLDAQNKPVITGSTDVAALSGAAGFVFDVTKNPSGRSFKAGLFVGRDFINSDPSINYRFNKANWIAIQIGFDFTDN